MGFMASPPFLIVGVWEYKEDSEDVQLDQTLKIPEQTRYHGEYFGGTESPIKLTCLLNTLNGCEFSHLFFFFPFSPV